MKHDHNTIAVALAAGAPIRRSGNWPSGTVRDETVMMNIATGDYVGLSETGGRIWELIQTPLTLAQLCEKLQAEYEVTRDEISDDVTPFIVELVQKGVVLLDTPDT